MKFENIHKIKNVYCKDGSYNQYRDNNEFSHEYITNSKGKIEYTEENIKFYYKGYLLHREDGPAVEYTDGRIISDTDIRNSYYLNGFSYSVEEYWNIINIKKKQQILESLL